MWTNKTFAELGYTYTGLSGKNKAAFGSGEPYIPYMNVFSNESVDPDAFEYVQIKKGERQNAVAVGDALFTTSSETPEEVGMSSVLTEDVGTVYLNSFCFGLHLYRPSDFDPKFLSYALRSERIRKQMFIAAQGSTRHNLSKQNFNRMKLQYPTDTMEQCRIAAVLTAADKAITASRALVEKYAAVKQGLMYDLLGKGELVRFSDIADNVTRKGRSTEGIVCLNMDCIESGSGKVVGRSYDSLSSDKVIFTTGDVLFAKLRPYLRKYWLAEFDGLCSSEFMVFKAKPNIRRQYLYYIVSSNGFVEYNNSQTYGTKMPRTSWGIVKKFETKVPKLEEQDEIIEVLAAADARLTTERARLKKVENIKRGLMDDLLTNRVSTDILEGGREYV